MTNPASVRFGQSVTVGPSRLLGRPVALSARVVERCAGSGEFFRVVFADGARETVHYSDMVRS